MITGGLGLRVEPTALTIFVPTVTASVWNLLLYWIQIALLMRILSTYKTEKELIANSFRINLEKTERFRMLLYGIMQI